MTYQVIYSSQATTPMSVSDLEEILHAFVGPDQAPFVVFRTRGNYDQNALIEPFGVVEPAVLMECDGLLQGLLRTGFR